ncbi:MAG: GTPase Era [Alphaproteobacteria bacterium CG_4_9_14_3_um_filter_47_13]|nr:MAG: GTPase Era [Alphaproteobacteria bacterium CG_4_9_14_3_um_filter_47_13]
MTQNDHKKRCGFVAVIGAPNAGKSTLINHWVGSKITIVSPKAQTTRSLVRGIVLHEESQIIFIDTPGIFRPKERLEKAMVAAAWQGEAEADLVMLVVDASKRKTDRDTLDILEKLAAHHQDRPCILVLNKIDKVAKEHLLLLAKNLNEKVSFLSTFMVSALKGKGLETVLDYIGKQIPESVWHFSEDQISDMPMRLLAAEITREKLFHKLYQELPYGLMVETEQWEEFDNGSVKISQLIYVARDSHKGIVLGKGGSQVKEIGEMARRELEEILQTRVHLKLFVKVQENWRDDPEKYLLWGLDYSA